MKRFILSAALLFAALLGAGAQGWEINTSIDNMSSYNWRGCRQSYSDFGYNMMLNLGFDYYLNDNLSFEAGIYDVEELFNYERTDGKFTELGAWISASYGNFTATIEANGLDTRLWNRRFDYRESYDLSLEYTFEFGAFQPTLQWNTMFAGDDYKYDLLRGLYEEGRAFSSYVEIALPFEPFDNLEVTGRVGANPWHSPYYYHYNSGFTFSNLGIDAVYTYEFDNGLTLPLKFEVGYNPAVKNLDINNKGWYFGVALTIAWTKELFN